jgi:phosphatidylinositol glycan class A protein
VEVIPEICRRFPSAHFIIGGDGNKRLMIEEMRERHHLHDRVEMLGEVQHKDVRSVLVRGHLFLNCSLTEAFCIAILEAVSCGLFVVSTKVGGVPEILPENMIQFAEPHAADIIETLSDAIPHAKNSRPMELHSRVKHMYNWHDVAERTERVYDMAIYISTHA